MSDAPTFLDGYTEGEITEENLWLDRLKDVLDNDPTATQNWYIPLLLLDYVGFDVDDLNELAEKLSYTSSTKTRNKRMNAVVGVWIEERIAYNKTRL